MLVYVHYCLCFYAAVPVSVVLLHVFLFVCVVNSWLLMSLCDSACVCVSSLRRGRADTLSNFDRHPMGTQRGSTLYAQSTD